MLHTLHRFSQSRIRFVLKSNVLHFLLHPTTVRVMKNSQHNLSVQLARKVLTSDPRPQPDRSPKRKEMPSAVRFVLDIPFGETSLNPSILSLRTKRRRGKTEQTVSYPKRIYLTLGRASTPSVSSTPIGVWGQRGDRGSGNHLAR
jgi:hypothetical protein